MASLSGFLSLRRHRRGLVLLAALPWMTGACMAPSKRTPPPLPPAPAEANVVVDLQNSESVAVVKNVRMKGGTVTGTVENRGSRTLRDVQLSIQYLWLWKNERNPGKDSPGRTEIYSVVEDIPSQGKANFEYRAEPPLPTRNDGHFDAVVSVLSFTEVGH